MDTGIRHLVGVHTPGEAPPSVISDSDRGPTCERVLQLFIGIRHPDCYLQIPVTVDCPYPWFRVFDLVSVSYLVFVHLGSSGTEDGKSPRYRGGN